MLFGSLQHRSVSEKEYFEDEIETDPEVAERYPWLAGGDVDETWGKPPPLSAKHQKILDLEREKLAAESKVTAECKTNYHILSELAEEHLPELNFRRYDNLFLARQANAFLAEETRGPGPLRRLFSDLWLSGELCVLFGDTGCGKSVLAMQIARAVSGGERFEPFEMDVEPQRVAYFDFELSDEHFKKRYSSGPPDTSIDEPLFPADLIRCTPQDLLRLPPGFEDYYEFLIDSMVDLVFFLKARIVIIDNITWLSSTVESAKAALRLMKTLVALKNRFDLSILVLAHTPKRYSRTRITAEHLQGSRMLSNFADSIFALGFSSRGIECRYLKSIKHRNAAARDIETEVAAIRIERSGRFLGFTFDGYTDERSHAGWNRGESESDRVALVKRIADLALKGHTQREIAKQLGMSAATVNRCLKLKEDGDE